MFGKFLMEKQVIDQHDLDKILYILKYYRNKIGRACLELGLISEEQLDQYLYEYLNPLCTYSIEELEEKAKAIDMSKDDKKFIYNLGHLAIVDNESKLVIIARKFSDQLIREYEFRFHKDVEMLIESKEVIELIRNKLLKQTDFCKRNSLYVAIDPKDDEKLNKNDPFAKIIKNCFVQAKECRASDIHFEPFENEFLIRMRVFGTLIDWKMMNSEFASSLTATLKYILNMNLAICDRPQDSRATFQDLGIDIRASSMPVTCSGEKIVLRLQYQAETISLKQLGLSIDCLNVLLQGIEKKDGLILISGPTGSGKTTTLYALLEEMDRRGKNISTLENPVEKRLARINQAQIFDHNDFDNFQRALMRQDPDVILLGEMRDSHTVQLGLKLASTGHLVLSTIHANGAVEVINRLTSLGADLYSIESNLRLSIAQRLIQSICQQCSIPMEGKLRKKNAQGCSQCRKGVNGRIAIIEYLEARDLVDLNNSVPKVRSSLKDEYERIMHQGLVDVDFKGEV